MNWRIVTGYYITALGQESERYYFKTRTFEEGNEPVAKPAHKRANGWHIDPCRFTVKCGGI